MILYKMLSEMFYTLVLTSSVAFVLAIAKIISKSRCEELVFFNCCRLKRNVILENLESRIETKDNN